MRCYRSVYTAIKLTTVYTFFYFFRLFCDDHEFCIDAAQTYHVLYTFFWSNRRSRIKEFISHDENVILHLLKIFDFNDFLLKIDLVLKCHKTS